MTQTNKTLSIVMLVKDRPRLTRQALESLVRNTTGEWNLTIVDDGSTPANKSALHDLIREWPNCGILHFNKSYGPGFARNEGIAVSNKCFGRPGLLYLCDNDFYALPGWDQILLQCWERVRSRFKGPIALGGYAHPFQQRGSFLGQPNAITGHSVRRLEALGLLSWLWEWETWDQLAPFEPSPTINGSEDVAMCRKITAAGGVVGVVEPQLVINCGVTSSNGKPCPGAAWLYEQQIPEGVVIE